MNTANILSKAKHILKGSCGLVGAWYRRCGVTLSLFLVILIVELVILIIHYEVETYEFKVFFLLLTLITGLALVVFTVEGALQNRRKHGNKTE